jgi:hypothetical protein
MRHKARPRISRVGIFAIAVLSSTLCAAYAFAMPPIRSVDVGDSEPRSRSYGDHRLTWRTDNCVGCTHDEKVIGHWSSKHFPTSYAGMYFVKGKAVRLVVGFTARQAARVRAVKKLPGLIKPQRISEFQYIPKYSLSELVKLQRQIVHDVMRDDTYGGLLVSVGVIVQANEVDVGTEQVKKARRLLKSLYGPDAPVRVRYEEKPAEV